MSLTKQNAYNIKLTPVCSTKHMYACKLVTVPKVIKPHRWPWVVME